MLSIKVETCCGASIMETFEDAQRLADRLKVNVEFKANEVNCIAFPGGSAKALERSWSGMLRDERRSHLWATSL